MHKEYRYFVGDFETTVYQGQTRTDVWASGLVELYTEDAIIFHNIWDTLEYLFALKSNLVVYYHNLKFDGSFWLDYLINVLGLRQASYSTGEKENEVAFLRNRDMPNNTFRYSISDKGMWYSITIKKNDKFIEIRDSLKLLPYSVKRIGKSFGTKHHKLDMKYEGFRYPGCEITPKEKEYLINDLLVVKEAIEIMFDAGHDRLTIGSCCLAEYKKMIGKYEWGIMFPDVYKIELNENEHRYPTVGEWVLKSYHGGWCYLKKGCENKLYGKGVTADVNSLYPSMMHSKSGNRYPVGKPCFWVGDYIPDKALDDNKYYFVRIRTRFYLKPNMLPTIQIKNSFLYRSTEWLETSDIYNRKDGNYYPYYVDKDGITRPAIVELTLTQTDFELLKDHYYLSDFEILDGCWFYSEIGLFDDYINKYAEQKKASKGAKREEAKLFLNNLYGKMASSTNSSFKYAIQKPDGSIGFVPVTANEKEPGYIPIGSAITSYARNFTIRTAQKNYERFLYADTDSIHCIGSAEELIGVPVDKVEFCCWKLESYWDEALYVRQKTYIEHVTHQDGEQIEDPYYDVKCAGMPENCKQLFLRSVLNVDIDNEEYTVEEKQFLMVKRKITDFKVGLRVPGKLMPKRIPGGTLLVKGYYEMR